MNCHLGNIVGLFCLFLLGTWPSQAAVFGRDGFCVDIIPEQCHRHLQPHYCYTERNRALCCATCQVYFTGKQECPYGDRNTVIERNSRLYTCKGYIGFYGKYRCRHPSFNTQCCASCNS